MKLTINRQYLFIQKQRYGEKLNYEILEDERLSDYQLPKLVLQPLVENAIFYHGIKEITGQASFEWQLKLMPAYRFLRTRLTDQNQQPKPFV